VCVCDREKERASVSEREYVYLAICDDQDGINIRRRYHDPQSV